MNEKSPWLAVSLNWLLPGSGYLYARLRMLCYFTFVLSTVETIVIFWTMLSADFSIYVTVQAVCLALFIQILICIHTYKHSCKRSSQIQASESERIWFAIFLSVLIPGLGYGYLRKWGFLILSLVLPLLLADIGHENPLIGTLLWIPFWVLIIFHHAYTYIKKEEDSSQNLRFIGFLSFYMAVSLLRIIFVYAIIMGYGLFAAVASSDGMKPAIETGDKFVVNKLVYQNHDPQVGDIVVFDPSESFFPEQTRKYERVQLFAKRVVAVAGEQVDLRSGELLINGKPRQLYASAAVKEEFKRSGEFGFFGPYTVPKDSFFVMGDNLMISMDSRHVGAISRHTIKGKVIKVYWPPKAAKKKLYDF